jgi:hypothetical protein
VELPTYSCDREAGRCLSAHAPKDSCCKLDPAQPATVLCCAVSILHEAEQQLAAAASSRDQGLTDAVPVGRRPFCRPCCWTAQLSDSSTAVGQLKTLNMQEYKQLIQKRQQEAATQHISTSVLFPREGGGMGTGASGPFG